MLTEFAAEHDGVVIMERLARVLDPELDESIVELGFVRTLRVRDDHAEVTLLLPTSWCAMNFAFMMAEDVRRALLAVDGVDRVTVRLADHCAAAEIETAVNEGKSFASAFPGEAGTGLAALRTVFLRKGFLMRQERLLRELRAAGCSAEEISAFRVGDLSLPGSIPTATADALGRYLERRTQLGLDGSPGAPLIVDQNGTPLPPDRLEQYYQLIRTVRVATEANGSFCRAVLATRDSSPRSPKSTGAEELHVQA
jgi:metal-sulfur cluster biosynthetic enzyme